MTWMLITNNPLFTSTEFIFFSKYGHYTKIVDLFSTVFLKFIFITYVSGVFVYKHAFKCLQQISQTLE